MRKFLAFAAAIVTSSLPAQTVANARLLGPQPTPTGCHFTPAEQPWLTPAEQSCYATTPTYNETMQYLNRVAGAAPAQVKIETFGESGEGRDLSLVIVSRDGTFDPTALHAQKRPIVLVQNSIHAGEMDGKDSCLALLRDMVITKTQAKLLDRAVFVFIPIYNADGHERRSPYNRINQLGPAEMGWRGNGTNLNLNRDYMKADAPETQAFLSMYTRWSPDLFVDDHVTDGADFQYDVTFSIDDGPSVPPATARWAREVANPSIARAVDSHPGHLASTQYIELLDENNLQKGLALYDDPPRFSTGYASLTGRPAMLVELHMLKSYQTRVTGNYWTLVGLLELVNQQADKLLALNAAADAATRALPGQPFPLSSEWSGKTEPFAFKGYQYTTEHSDISGRDWVQYTHTPATLSVPVQVGYKPTDVITAPAAYLVPAQWKTVIDRLALHGAEITRTTAPYTAQVDTYHCTGMTWQDSPFEGHHPTFNGESHSRPGKFGQCTPVHETRSFPTGSALVRTAQRMGPVAIEWLEPSAPDCALQWGFFDPIFEQKEYGEPYVVERLAREMEAADPALKAEFDAKVASDSTFAASPTARLDFFYQRSDFGKANHVGDYPVARFTDLTGVPIP